GLPGEAAQGFHDGGVEFGRQPRQQFVPQAGWGPGQGGGGGGGGGRRAPPLRGGPPPLWGGGPARAGHPPPPPPRAPGGGAPPPSGRRVGMPPSPFSPTPRSRRCRTVSA